MSITHIQEVQLKGIYCRAVPVPHVGDATPPIFSLKTECIHNTHIACVKYWDPVPMLLDQISSLMIRWVYNDMVWGSQKLPSLIISDYTLQMAVTSCRCLNCWPLCSFLEWMLYEGQRLTVEPVFLLLPLHVFRRLHGNCFYQLSHVSMPDNFQRR